MRKKLNHIFIGVKIFFLAVFGFMLYRYQETLPRFCRYPFPFILCPACDYPCFFKIYQSKIGLGIFLTGLISGRIFCGSACPVGSTQDGLYFLKSRLLPNINFNWETVDHVLRILKYPLLLLVLLYSLIRFALAFEFMPSWGIVPAMHITLNVRQIAGREYINFWLIFLISAFVAGIVIHRAWCKYLCPAGLIFAMFNKLSLIKIRFEQKLHSRCSDFSKSCTTGKPRSMLQDGLSSLECIRCYKCVAACPKDALYIKSPFKNFKSLFLKGR